LSFLEATLSNPQKLLPHRLQQDRECKVSPDPETKLKGIGTDRVGTIWNNKNYRIDVGSKINGSKTIKTWNLQVNREAERPTKNLLKSGNTHEKLYWDQFDTGNTPDYHTFVQNILRRF
jgi:hypothetical protein